MHAVCAGAVFLPSGAAFQKMHIYNGRLDRFKNTILGGLAWIGLAGVPSSFAIEEDDSTIYDLDQFVVISSRTELPLDQVGSSVEVLTRTDFEKSKQPFLNEALRTVPGLLLRNNGGPGQVIGMTTRGLNTNRPTVLLNGVEVSNPASGQMLNFGTFATSSVEKVEVLKGPQSSLYGADALAGVISIQTQDGSRDSGSSADILAGSYDTYQASVGNWGSQGDWSYFSSVSWFDSGGYSVQDPSLGEAWADDDSYRNLNALLNLNYQLSEQSSLNGVAYYIDSRAEFDPGNPDFIFGEPFADNYTETEQTFVKVALKSEVSDQWTSTLSAGLNETRDFSNSSFPLSANGDRFELDWNNSFKASDSYTLVAGAKYEKEENKTDAFNRSEESLFIENVFSPSQELALTLGGRYDDNSAYGDETTYRGTFSYAVLGEEENFLKLRGSYGTSFQAPTFFQLFSFFGNPDVLPETGTGWDIGLEGTSNGGAISYGVTYFDYDIEDKIVYSFATNSFANEDRYFSQGFENYLSAALDENVSLRIAYTYSDAEYADGVTAERVPNDVISTTLDWGLPEKGVQLSLTHLFVGKQFDLRGDGSKRPSYSVFNVALTYELSDLNELWLRVDNVFDKEYQEVATYETAGFSVYAGVRFRF